MAEPTTEMINQAFFERLESGDSGMQKQAGDAVNEFTRTRIREDGFARKILPPQGISNDQLDRQVDTDKPVKVIDMEPGSRGAYMVPFATTPLGQYIRGRRYRVMFARIMTPKFNKDIEELRTYHMDIRQVISDNAIKDMLAEEDGKFLYAVNAAIGGAAGATVTETNAIQWKSTTQEITRETWAESLKIMPGLPNSLNAATVLMNNLTYQDFYKMRRDEVGGDKAQDIFFNGMTEETIGGKKIVVTIKKDLVPNSTMFQFAEPKFLGKFFTLTDATMSMKKENFMIEFFAYSCIGAAIGNVASLVRYDFNAGANL